MNDCFPLKADVQKLIWKVKVASFLILLPNYFSRKLEPRLYKTHIRLEIQWESAPNL